MNKFLVCLFQCVSCWSRKNWSTTTLRELGKWPTTSSSSLSDWWWWTWGEWKAFCLPNNNGRSRASDSLCAKAASILYCLVWYGMGWYGIGWYGLIADGRVVTVITMLWLCGKNCYCYSTTLHYLVTRKSQL